MCFKNMKNEFKKYIKIQKLKKFLKNSKNGFKILKYMVSWPILFNFLWKFLKEKTVKNRKINFC